MPGAFDVQQIPKCQDRLQKAKRAFYECRNSNTIVGFRSNWADFLIHSGSLLNALDAGSNFTPQGKQWYGMVKRAGREDPLVSYMHQSRNVEEHGRGHVTADYSGMPFGFKDQETGEIEWHSDSYERDPSKKRGIVIGAPPSGPALRSVTDERFDKIFHPPETHKGKPILNNDPITVGELYILYLEDLLRKAEEIS